MRKILSDVQSVSWTMQSAACVGPAPHIQKTCEPSESATPPKVNLPMLGGGGAGRGGGAGQTKEGRHLSRKNVIDIGGTQVGYRQTINLSSHRILGKVVLLATSNP